MKNYQKISMDDIIFENRNKQYGAYELRQNINRHSSIGLLATVSAFVAILIIYTYNPFSRTTIQKPEVELFYEFKNLDFPKPEIVKPIIQAAPLPAVVKQFAEYKPVVDVAITTIPNAQEDVFNKPIGAQEILNPNGSGLASNPTTNTTIVPGTEVVETTIAKPIETNKIETYVDVMPSYNGGKDAMMEYLRKNIKPFSSDVEKGGTGKVILRFYVDTDGTVRNPEVLKDNIGGRCAEAAINAIKKMPKWNAGKQKGIPVKVYFTLPVTFDFNKI